MQGKRERLVAAAREVIHHQGVEKTTIADIAREADVPVGNVYYYFKTKDELVKAAIDRHVRDIQSLLAPSSATARHRRGSRRWSANSPPSANSPHSTAARSGACAPSSTSAPMACTACAQMLRLPIDWAEQQFRLIGRRDARDLAVALMAAYQGIALLTNTFSDPELMTREARRIERWIDSLA